MKVKNETKRELAPEGTHPARCVHIVDLGTQYNKKWDSEERLVSIGFQLVDEKTEKGDAMMAYRKFTLLSTPKSGLGKFVKSWLDMEAAYGESLEYDDILNEPGLIKISHSEDGAYANVESMSPLLKDSKTKKPMLVAKATEPVFSLWLDETFDEEVFKTLPDWMQKMIKETTEYKDLMENTSGKSKGKGKEKEKPAATKGKSGRK